MHLAVRRGGAAVGARGLRTPGLQRRLPATGSCIASGGGARGFSFSPRSFFSSSASAGNSRGAAKAAAFFLDAQAACKNKRCALRKGVTAAPEACGEDSYFVSPSVVGVADGVGGWNENGVDPGEISRSLMRNASAFVRESADAGLEVTTQRVLAHAYAQALLDESVEAGSTTACLVRVKESAAGTPVLEYSNLGDSGFVVIRDNTVIFRSKFQVRATRFPVVAIFFTPLVVDPLLLLTFACDLLCATLQYYGRAPYQLAKIPPRFKSYGAIENHPRDVRLASWRWKKPIRVVVRRELTDCLCAAGAAVPWLVQADSGEIEVQDGDIIVLATDGVWDNFSPTLVRAPSFQPVREVGHGYDCLRYLS